MSQSQNATEIDDEFNAIQANFTASMQRAQHDLNTFLQRAVASINTLELQPPTFRPAINPPDNNNNARSLAVVPVAGHRAVRPAVTGVGALLQSGSLVEQDDRDPNRLRLRFDLQQFEPGEVQVHLRDGRLQVHAAHRQSTPGRQIAYEFRHELRLPPGLPAAAVHMDRDDAGVLSVDADLTQFSAEATTPQRKQLTQ